MRWTALPHGSIILDACCVITLYESGQMEAILRATGQQVVLASYVHEVEIRRADLGPLIDAGTILIVSPRNETEENAYVNFAVELDDGEAVTGAIAIHRNWAIATDEAKATAYFSRVAPRLEIASTPDLVKHWVEQVKPAREEVRAVLQRIELRARYQPGPNHPLRGWWRVHHD